MRMTTRTKMMTRRKMMRRRKTSRWSLLRLHPEYVFCKRVSFYSFLFVLCVLSCGQRFVVLILLNFEDCPSVIDALPRGRETSLSDLFVCLFCFTAYIDGVNEWTVPSLCPQSVLFCVAGVAVFSIL